ncbi:MAG: M48 family metalloprotease [Desulfobulbales bacterium]|nr:M48 family metalloprotease [Desulfobulbales bacterium]
MLPIFKQKILRMHVFILSLAIITGQLIGSGPLRAGSFSIDTEKEIGEKMYSAIRKEFALVNDPDVAQYINTLGRQVLTVAGAQYFDYRFFVIANKNFNAFAAPSGLIFFHSGLIAAMDNEEELLGVMAHEIAHVSNRHLADRIDKAGKVNIGTIALILAGIALGSSGEGELSEAVVTGAMATGASMNLKFSRENEEEADRLAFSWILKMKRNPESMLSMLGKMRRISILKMGNIPPYLLTHPNPTQRLSYVQDLLNIYQGRLPEHAGSDFEFQRIRYRIMAATNDNRLLIPRLTKKIKDGEDPDYLLRLGLAQIYLSEGNYEQGRKYLLEVMGKYPDRAILKTDLGYTYLGEGLYEEALSLFRKALQDDPNDAFTIFNLARALDQSGHTEKAIKYYEELLDMAPTYAKTHYYLGQAHPKQGRIDMGHYHTGLYNWFEGNITNAKYHLAKAIEKLPADSIYAKKSKEMLDKIDRLEKL